MRDTVDGHPEMQQSLESVVLANGKQLVSRIRNSASVDDMFRHFSVHQTCERLAVRTAEPCQRLGPKRSNERSALEGPMMCDPEVLGHSLG